MKKLLVLLSSAALAITALVGGSLTGESTRAASADSGSGVDGESVAALHSFLIENGVSAEDAERIAADFKNGRLPDSATGAAPVRIESVTRGDAIVNRTVYPDGSVSVTGRETGSSGYETRSVSQCSVSSGSGYSLYRNCLVFAGNGLVGMSFHANYQIVHNGYDSITWHGAPGVACAGVSCDTPYFAGMNARESYGSIAYVFYYMRAKFGAFTKTLVLTLNVGSNSAWTTSAL